MKALISTVSAVVIGFSSLTVAGNAQADSFSISLPDVSFSYSDDEYTGGGYSETPIYIVNNGWSSPRYRHDRHDWHHGHRGHKYYKRYRHGYHKRHW